ncbi:MAG: NADH-quinone oxidoreductase subunit NuoK [Deltaproteobacteria bacterium]|nr:NADH-quinone oxidoreductase subunit NuoK [Deltaproteobacteria bacterium]
MTITISHLLVVSIVLLASGLYCVITRKNAVALLMGIELILNAANLNLVAFSRFVTGDIDGQVFALFGILLAAAETVVALAIVLQVFRAFDTVDVDRTDKLRG